LRSGTGEPGPVFLLGYYLGQLISQASLDRGLCLLEERDGGLELALVGGELVGGQPGQWVLGLVDRGGCSAVAGIEGWSSRRAATGSGYVGCEF
jgi:hypothetical protein